MHRWPQLLVHPDVCTEDAATFVCLTGMPGVPQTKYRSTALARRNDLKAGV